jgi:hypothetical protein
MSRNPYSFWNKSPSSAQRSTDPDHAANRILDGYFTPRLIKGDLTLERSQDVFTMGSCFAREIEHALRRRGFTIASMDIPLLETGDFRGEDGKVSTGFFHRFNVPSMAQEFQRVVGDIEFDESRSLLVDVGNSVYDLNYFGPTLPRRDRAGAVARRRMAGELVQRFTRSRVIIVTLGLCEAWYHKPSELYCNSVAGDVLARRRDEFEFREIGYEENLASLEVIRDSIAKHHIDGSYRFVVTVSPVPLLSTFSDDDIVVANCRAKTTLRAVAAAFCERHTDAIYFPSFEIAMYSNPELVWRPDRVHVRPECVAHITETFIGRFVKG